MRRLIFAFSALFWFALGAGCQPPAASSATAPAKPNAEIVQWSGQRSGKETAGTRPIRTAAEWTAFWSEVGLEPPQAWPTRDTMAVVIYLGQKRTGGYSARVLAARVENAQLVIDYRSTSPAPGALVMQMLTTPWVLALVPPSDLPVIARTVTEDRPAP